MGIAGTKSTSGGLERYQSFLCNPKITPSRRKVTQAEREKKESEKNTVNSGHLVP